MKIHGIIRSIIGGIILNGLSLLIGYYSYIFGENGWQDDRWIILLCTIVGCIVTIFPVLYKCSRLRQALVRVVVLLVSQIMIFAVHGYLGWTLMLRDALNVPTGESTGNAIALMQGLFLITVVSICVIVVIIRFVIQKLLERNNV